MDTLTSVQIRAIKRALKALGICWDESSISVTKFTGGVTNQFFILERAGEPQHLIRMNGVLWPPFTRHHEAENLESLHRAGLPTRVLINDVLGGIQICAAPNKKRSLDYLFAQDPSLDLMTPVAKAMRQYHGVSQFSGHYPLGLTLENSLRRSLRQLTAPGAQKTLQKLASVIFKLIKVVTEDHDNHVFSHNDPLPSSIFFDQSEASQVSIVDWEYSGQNHRVYDLAIVAHKLKLNSADAMSFVQAYDPDNRFNSVYYFTFMRPIISFLIGLWEGSAMHSTSQLALRFSIQEALRVSAVNKIKFEYRLASAPCTPSCGHSLVFEDMTEGFEESSAVHMCSMS